MSEELVNLIAKKFIQRRDVKAVQFSSGAYVPDVELKNPKPHEPFGFKRSHIESHINCEATYGHYLLDTEGKCRVFAFDIDLEKSKYDENGNQVEPGGFWVDTPPFDGTMSDSISNEEFDKLCTPYPCDPRKIWHDRRQVAARKWYKTQMGMLARNFATIISRDIGIPCAAAYSGNKGVHVYGFTGSLDANEVREAAMMALDISDQWEPSRGKNFFRHKLQDPTLGYPSFSLEVFPKQDSTSGTKGYGNLMRLPLGKNLKAPDNPTFFIDLNTPVSELSPHSDPVALLESGDPYL